MTIYAVYSKKWLMPGLTSESENSVRNLMRDWAFQTIRPFFSYTTSVEVIGYNRGTQSARHTSGLHRVYMAFALRESWRCEFTELDSRTPLPCKLTFASADKLREMAERGGALSNLESRQMLEFGIQAGRGGVTLKLTADQLARLKGGS
jgi:hypothetical protein